MAKKHSIPPVLKWLITFVTVIGVVMIIRSFCVASYRIDTGSVEGSLREGDCILVNKLPIKGNPGRDRLVLFTDPDLDLLTKKALFLGRCAGMPGDIVQINDSLEIVIPESYKPYFLDEETFQVYQDAILHETDGKAVFRDGKIFLDDQESSFFFFRQNYYWIASDHSNEEIEPRHPVLIPADHIIGNAWFCWFSNDKTRLFKRIK